MDLDPAALFRSTTVTQRGIEWSGLFEQGTIPWDSVARVTVNIPAGLYLTSSQGIDFYRIEFEYVRKEGRTRRLVGASYVSYPEALALRCIRSNPDAADVARLERELREQNRN